MSQYKWQGSYSAFGGLSLTRTVKNLIIINVALFVLVHLLPRFPWLSVFGLVPADVFAGFKVWQLATYMFLHAGMWHLAVNMLMLWFFAPAIEASWGRKQFLTYYFFTGIGAGLCSWVASPHSFVPVIGASGAIFGLLVAYAMMFPETVILLFFIFPMKIKYAVYIFAAMNLWGALGFSNAGIAYFAHLGGGLFGYLYLKSEWIQRKLSYLGGSSLKKRRRAAGAAKKQVSEKNIEEKVDAILDKISRHGVKSLSKKEKRILDMRSKGQNIN
jgi:membrane associated rhomboid family serine protease